VRVADDWQLVRGALIDARVSGVDDLGVFVNNTQYFAPSTFDERAAAPVLLDLLPSLGDSRVVNTVGRHLRGPWLRRMDGAYEIVREAYVRWAPSRDETGWVLGDTLCKAADATRAADLLALAGIDDHGMARGCIVEALWRFKAVVDVEPLLRRLVGDPTVTYMAMSSLQRTIGAQAMLPLLEQLLGSTTDSVVRAAADRQLRRVRRKLATLHT
jgi:hypothetical protein